MNTLFVIFPFNTVKFDQSNGELCIVVINLYMNSLFGSFILLLPNQLSQSNGARDQEVKRCAHVPRINTCVLWLFDGLKSLENQQKHAKSNTNLP